MVASPVGDGPLRSGQFSRGPAWYRSLYKITPQTTYTLDASTYYFHAPDSPQLIASQARDPRFIFLLRDPVERLQAHYAHEVRAGHSLPPLDSALRDKHPRALHYIEISRYETHLRRFRSQFSADRILVLRLEDLHAKPAAVKQSLSRFLEIDLGHISAQAPKSNASNSQHWQPLDRIARSPAATDLRARFPRTANTIKRLSANAIPKSSATSSVERRLSHETERMLRRHHFKEELRLLPRYLLL